MIWDVLSRYWDLLLSLIFDLVPRSDKVPGVCFFDWVCDENRTFFKPLGHLIMSPGCYLILKICNCRLIFKCPCLLVAFNPWHYCCSSDSGSVNLSRDNVLSFCWLSAVELVCFTIYIYVSYSSLIFGTIEIWLLLYALLGDDGKLNLLSSLLSTLAF